jgi:hypothetical protein
MAIGINFKHLEHRPSSNYQQLWVKGRHMRAEILYRLTVGPEPQTPQEVAQDYDYPVLCAPRQSAVSLDESSCVHFSKGIGAQASPASSP